MRGLVDDIRTALPMLLERAGTLDLDDQTLEYREYRPEDPHVPTLVLLHEGLGSLGLWRDFPEKLADETRFRVFAYSRAGYGASSPVPLPRPLTYMHEEAQRVLPQLLEIIEADDVVLVGHSDGASIAAIYAGTFDDPRLRGISLMAPHFIVEDVSVRSIADAKMAYETTDLRDKLAKWHTNVDVAFRGWNDAWLDAEFRNWDIRDFLAEIEVPVQIIQGEGDQFGTIRQIELAREKLREAPDVLLMKDVKHAPWKEGTEATLEAIAAFCERVTAQG